jgi:hypothetical protein
MDATEAFFGCLSMYSRATTQNQWLVNRTVSVDHASAVCLKADESHWTKQLKKYIFKILTKQNK